MARTRNSVINATVGVGATVVDMVAQFILRQQFVWMLGDQLYGLNSVFTTIISMLSLAELGVGSVICFSLYKPIAEKNKEEIIALMQLYKGYYFKISFIILGMGILFSPFMPYFMVGYQLDTTLLYQVYSIFILDAFVSYFFSYNKTFLIAVQKNAIINLIRISYTILSTILLVLLVRLGGTYLFYLSVWMFLRVCENATSYWITNRNYPFLKDKKRHLLSPIRKEQIVKNIKALIMHRVGGMLALNADNLIVAKFVGVVGAGFYSNYLLITSGIHKMVVQVFDGVRASFGDFAVQKDEQETKQIFYVLQLVAFLIYTWCSIFILSLCQPFVSLWMGKDRQIPFIALIVMVFNFYLRGFRSPVDLIKDVKGIYWQDRYKSMIEGLVKVISSIFLGYFWGYTGVILGTTISFLLVLLTVEPYVVYKYAFHEKVNSYYIDHVKYFFIAFIICSAITTGNIMLLNQQNLFLTLIYRFFICLFVPPIYFYFIFRKTMEFQYLSRLFSPIKEKFLGGFKRG